MARIYSDNYQILTLTGGANSNTNPQDVKNYKTACITLVVGAGYNGTVKFAGSYSDSVPNFGAAASASNIWDYVQAVNLNTGNFITGSTGLVAPAAGLYQFEINVNALKHFGIITSGANAGAITAYMQLFEDNA